MSSDFQPAMAGYCIRSAGNKVTGEPRLDRAGFVVAVQ
jgi:hypothetical protein